MANQSTKTKPGPDPERLKIEGDPEEALRKLLTAKLPEKPEAKSDESDEDSPRD